MISNAEKEAAAVFGMPAVHAVKGNQAQAEAALLKNAQAVHAAIRQLRPLLPDIKKAVAFGQSLPQDVTQGLIFLWLGYGKKRKTIEKMGISHEDIYH